MRTGLDTIIATSKLVCYTMAWQYHKTVDGCLSLEYIPRASMKGGICMENIQRTRLYVCDMD